ncbi:MAG: glycosyltransferase family 39 protein [archaeon]
MTKSEKTGVFGNAFWQLLVVYTVLVVLISLSLMWKYALHFEIFAIVLALIGAVGLKHIHKDEGGGKISKAMHYGLLAIALILIIMFRVVPYVGNDIPLGYDAGIYKYGIENFASEGFGSDNWVRSALTPGYLYLMALFLKFGLSSQFLLTWGFILFGLLLGFAVYLFSREYLGERPAVIAVLLYAVSIIQFKLFTYMYYKNVMALCTLLFALYFLKRAGSSSHPAAPNRYHTNPPGPRSSGMHEADVSNGRGWNWNLVWFIVFGVLTGIFHRATFFLFGLAYISLVLHDWKRFRKNVLAGVLILGFTLVLYLGFWETSILPIFAPVAEGFVDPGTAPGTFVSFFVYQFSTLYYLPFAMLGFIYLIWRKKFDMLFFMTLIAGVIVYFQFFFFNRFIAHLDIFLIILAASGFSLLIDNGKKLGTGILVLMVVSAGYVTLQESINAKPLISQDGLALIEMIDSNVPGNAKVMSISSEYSPWVLAYSNRVTIAPGLFDENKWSQDEWEKFWGTQDVDETKALMSSYPGEVYLFAGTASFNNPCFEEFLDSGRNKLLRYTCG